ncbi:shikimate kinase [Listeria immobilis]|uniref:shikimate kinase n=1 Tax=Listeria immobilis TaxID=2713502 RepID=UPI001629899E|nr:shikimate kinase [Listeria immobilis]MBC1517215.1 DNA topology modulation protein [Listeria immobilis]
MKIRIIGSVGSGKTTLARKLSDIEGIPYFETDQLVWKREQTEVRRPNSEKAALLRQILQKEVWIIEGVHIEPWTMDSFNQADIIVFLDFPKKQIRYQLIKRQVKQWLRIESAHYPVKWKMLQKMFYWDNLFTSKSKAIIHTKMMENPEKWLVFNKNIGSEKLARTILQIISSRDIL